MTIELPPFRCPKCDVIMEITSVEARDGKHVVNYECEPCGTHAVKVVPGPANRK